MTGAPCIREAREADLPALAEVEAACFPDPWGEGAIRGQLASEACLSFVAEEKGAPGGALVITSRPPAGGV